MTRPAAQPTAAALHVLADRCRQQARTVSSQGVRATLLEMACDYAQRAAELDRAAA